MAIIFQLYAECNTDGACAELVKHFHGLQSTLLSGKAVSWSATVEHGFLNRMSVSSDELSRAGVRTLQDSLETTEAGILLYNHLKNGPDFHYARVAWEAQSITAEELGDYRIPMMPGESRLDIECAFDETLYRQLGSPQFCYPFRRGYWWTRYRGESYQPLYSNDQKLLNDRVRTLFPEYFKY